MTVELRDLTPDERKEVQQRFDQLATKRFAPMPKKPRHEVWWPKAPLDGRAFPEGILPPEGDDSFNESVRLLGFLNGVCGGGEFYVANLSAPRPHFRHTGKLDAELARWIRTRLVSNPTCVLASTVDVFLIIDSQMNYSVIGGPPEVIEVFERRFGGPDALRQTFENYVAQMRVGSGIDDVKWAQDYLQKWSGWT
jgi:hypothetical protein